MYGSLILGPFSEMPDHRKWLLQLIEHFRHRALHLQRLLDFISAEERILAVFKETRDLVRAHKSGEPFRVGLPVHRKALEVLEHRPDAGSAKKGHGVFSVLIEVGIEDSLVHEVRVAFD